MFDFAGQETAWTVFYRWSPSGIGPADVSSIAATNRSRRLVYRHARHLIWYAGRPLLASPLKMAGCRLQRARQCFRAVRSPALLLPLSPRLSFPATR